MTEKEYERFYRKCYHLPGQIERTRAKLARLEGEARSLGMLHLIGPAPRECDIAIPDAARSVREHG